MGGPVNESNGDVSTATVSQQITWSSRRYGQHPHHQSKKDQSRQQSKQGMERVKVKVRVPRQTMSGQHMASFCTCLVCQRSGLSVPIFSPFGALTNQSMSDMGMFRQQSF